MRYKIGVDIGASKILGIIVNNKGNIFRSIKIKTPKNRKDFLSNLYELIAALIDLVGRNKVSGIGLAVAGVLDNDGKTLNSPNMKFINNLNLKRLIFKKFKKPTKIINDARAFLLYELKSGVAKNHKNIVVLTLGSGIGGSLAIDGKIVQGATNSAGEIGHTIIKVRTRKPKDEIYELEDLAAAKAMSLGYKKMGENLGISLANIVNILNPEIIVIGGGLASAGEKILSPAKKIMKKYIISPKAKNTPIVIEKNYAVAGALGTAIL